MQTYLSCLTCDIVYVIIIIIYPYCSIAKLICTSSLLKFIGCKWSIVDSSKNTYQARHLPKTCGSKVFNRIFSFQLEMSMFQVIYNNIHWNTIMWICQLMMLLVVFGGERNSLMPLSLIVSFNMSMCQGLLQVQYQSAFS